MTLNAENQKRKQASQKLFAAIEAEVAQRIEKRGNRKQPSNSAILKDACRNAGLVDNAGKPNTSSYYRIKRKLAEGK